MSMTPTDTEPQYPIPVETCQHCDTVLVYQTESLATIRFTGHDEEFCKISMRAKINMLEALLETKTQESAINRELALQYKGWNEESKRQVEDMRGYFKRNHIDAFHEYVTYQHKLTIERKIQAERERANALITMSREDWKRIPK